MARRIQHSIDTLVNVTTPGREYVEGCDDRLRNVKSAHQRSKD